MKKFLSYFNIFEPNLTLRSCKSPIIRIIVSLTVMLSLSIFRFCITIENPFINLPISLLFLIIVVLSILCFILAAVELVQAIENIKNDKERNK